MYEKNYQVLPHVLGDGWSLEVRLKKSDLSNSEYTINDVHPANKGFFLYIGTRAENKWREKYYKTGGNYNELFIRYQNDYYLKFNINKTKTRKNQYIFPKQNLLGSFTKKIKIYFYRK